MLISEGILSREDIAGLVQVASLGSEAAKKALDLWANDILVRVESHLQRERSEEAKKYGSDEK